MVDDNDFTYGMAGDQTGRPQESGTRPVTRKPYVRQPRPRKTAEAIDNLEQDDLYATTYVHDSNISVGGAPLSSRPYSRSRSDTGRLQRDLHYGQLLEVPKGKRQIFASRERSRQVRSRICLVAIIAALILVLVLVLGMAA